MQAIAPACLPLAPISGEILIAALQFGHLAGQFAKTDHLREALPGDGALAALDTMAACAALRAPNLPTAVARLNAMVTRRAGSGQRLEDMTGDTPALAAARRIVSDLRAWRDGRAGWHEISRSLLLYGPPGTGKTWLARAIGNSAGIVTVTASFAQWQAKGHLGDMLREMRATFAEARRLAPCVMIIDEIDAVGSRSDNDRHASNYRAQVINGFLAEMDTLARDEGVVLVGTTNNIERMDPAVLRAGRIDLKVQVPLPDAQALLAILRHHLRAEITKEEIADTDLARLSHLAVGRSPAEIDAEIRAARSDARHERKSLSLAMLMARLDIDPADENPARLWRIAVHEAGHAIMAAALELGPVARLQVSQDGGQTLRQLHPHQELLADYEAEIAFTLGGRAAERLLLGEISAGAGGSDASDLALATRHAVEIETTLGLGHEGLVWHARPDEVHLRTPAIRDRVRLRLQKAEQQAGKVLMQYQATLEGLARELLAKRSMGAAEIELWLRGVAPPPSLPRAKPSAPTSRELASSA